MMRMSRWLIAALVVVACNAELARSQHSIPPLYLTSIEWLSADAELIVRGVVVEVAGDQAWNIVTLDVLETLKGTKCERVKFAVHKFDRNDTAANPLKKSKQEQVWLLKRHDAGVPGEAPDREKVLTKHNANYHAPFLHGRPGSPALPMIPLGALEAGQTPAPLLTMDLRVLKTSEEQVKAIRSAIKDGDAKTPARAYHFSIPKEIAEGTGFSRPQNTLAVPHDGRLEAVARRLVQSPRDLGTMDAHIRPLRIEGIKALRHFPTEKNLALVRAWLDDPQSAQPIKERTTLAPAAPKGDAPPVALPTELAKVPEIHFQQPLTKSMPTLDAQLHTAATIDAVHLVNKENTDAFLVELMKKRPDLSGLSFAMGDACRMKPAAGKQFVSALEVFRKAEAQMQGVPQSQSGKFPVSAQPELKTVVRYYEDEVAKKQVDPSASVAALMQVLGPEDARTRLALTKYLETLTSGDATHALARLAIFSAESEIRTAAVAALKKRDQKEYSAILVSGLSYPWPAVAERAGEAIARLKLTDLTPQLIDVLARPDPRAPQTRAIAGKETTVVRELVRVNHHHNCLLCHAPATLSRDKASTEQIAALEGLTAQIPVPSESMVAYYRPSSPDILVRFDVTYLRQDFSTKLPVANADPWPELQRYDFLVRTREVTAKDADAYRQLLQPGDAKTPSPYHAAAVAALRELTGLDVEPNAAAWRKAVAAN